MAMQIYASSHQPGATYHALLISMSTKLMHISIPSTELSSPKYITNCASVKCSKINASHLFPLKLQQIQGHSQKEQFPSPQTLFFHIVTNVIYAFWERSFLLWADSCLSVPGMWFVTHIAVATVETSYPPSNCAHIQCLVSIEIQ